MLFRNTSVDAAISGLTKAIDRLDQAGEYHELQADVHVQEAKYQESRASFHKNEATRAIKVANNIRDLITV